MKRAPLFSIVIITLLSTFHLTAREMASATDEANGQDWFLRISFGIPVLDFKLSHQRNTGDEIKSEGEVNYSGNIPLTFGGTLFYQNYGLSLSFALPETMDSEAKYGSKRNHPSRHQAA